jgi:hypothetical protein
MSLGTSSSLITKIAQQKSATLAYLNTKIRPAYEQANTALGSIPRAKLLLEIPILTKGECEELNLTVGRMFRDVKGLEEVTHEFNYLVQDLYDLVSANAAAGGAIEKGWEDAGV